MGQVEWARELARSLLEHPLPQRWAHTQGVAAQAETLRPILGNDADLLIAAAWLHDIGYSPTLVNTGFHPLDGARYLRDAHQADNQLCSIVAYHTYSIVEAEERNLASILRAEFTECADHLASPMIFCDMTTGPTGERFSIDDRLSEIATRYQPDHEVRRAIDRSSHLLAAAVEAVEQRRNASR